MSDDLSLINPDLLPPQARQLVKLIGMGDTLKLLRHCGGIPTYVAEDPARSKLRGVISDQSLALLCKEYPGSIIDLPKADKMATQIRNHIIVTSTESGRKLAKRFDLTYRWIKIVRAAHADDQQSDLFDH